MFSPFLVGVLRHFQH